MKTILITIFIFSYLLIEIFESTAYAGLITVKGADPGSMAEVLSDGVSIATFTVNSKGTGSYAIDKYKDFNDAGYLGAIKADTFGYPESLDILVEGVKLNGPDGKKIRFLRKVPRDPFTGKNEWGLRSDQDDPKSTSWGGQNVFAVYSKTTQKAPDGTSYSEW